MCGRLMYRYEWERLARWLHLTEWPRGAVTPRYNVAPTQEVPVVRRGEGGGREARRMGWGIVPAWADGRAGGTRLFNARGETVGESRMFRGAFASRRCLVPVSGFYEWRRLGDGRTKQPYLIERADGAPFALGGVWERSEAGGTPMETFTIITTGASEFMSRYHDRMPVLIAEEDFDRWLGPGEITGDERARLLRPAAMEGFRAVPVGRGVNNPRREGPEVAAPVAEPDESGGMLF